VSREQYQYFSQWMEQELLLLLLEFSQKKPWRVKCLSGQLPTDYHLLFNE